MSNRIIVLLLFCTNFIFAACSSDDGEENNSSTRPAITVNGKYLIRINSSELEYNAQGQLVKVKTRNSNGSSRESNYSYEAKRILTSNPDATYYLKDGRVSECRYTMITSLDENALSIDVRETYEYDSNGYLVKETRPGYDYTEDRNPVITMTYEWQDGNIYKITSTDEEYVTETTMSYTSYPNNIPNFSQEFSGSAFGYLGWQGYFGKKCKNLPSKAVTTRKNGYPERSTSYYDYTIEDGVVKKITVKMEESGYQSTYIYELEWY